MNRFKSAIMSPLAYKAIIGLYLFIYLTIGAFTELRQAEIFPIPGHLFEDFGFYERALSDALDGKDPYAIRSIGRGYLYPPQALLVVELFSQIKPFFLKVSIYSVVNIALLEFIVYGVARYYGYSIERVWYWFVISFGFAPFLELLHIGQINVITLFGIFMLFLWEDTSPLLGGIGLSLAVITKVSPLLFLGYLVVHKKYKVLVFAISATALLTLLSVLRYGTSPLLTYPSVFQGLLQQFLLTRNSQSLAAKLAVANYPQFQEFLAALPAILRQPVGSVFLVFTTHYRIVQRILTLYILLVIIVSGLLTYYGKQPKEPLFIITALGMMLSPNILWYHHFVFMLLPLFIWMGWSRLKVSVVTWCLMGLLIVQFDRRVPPYGLLIHIFGNISLLSVLLCQMRQFYLEKIGRIWVPE